MNQNYYDPNLFYNSNSSDFDQYQPPQYSITHQPLHIKSMADLLLEEKLSQSLQALCEKLNKNVQEKQEEKNVTEEQAAKVSSQYWKPPIYYDDDGDDEESSIPLRNIISKLPLSFAIALDFPITNSLIIEDEHLNTIPETESDEENESSVKDLNLTLSESEDLSEDLSNYKSECDVPVCDDSSSKNEGLDDIVSIPPGKEINQLDAIPDSVQSFLNRANSIIFLIEEFVGELAPIDPIPLGIVEADFDPKEDIRLIEKLLNDDSSPKELNFENPDAIIKSFSPYPIPVEDSDSLMEEINIFLASDDSIPPDTIISSGKTMLVQGQILQGEGSTIPVESHHTPTVAPSTSQPHYSPTLRDFIRQEIEVLRPSSLTQTHVADEAASTDRVVSLETDLQQTKKVYGAAYTKLIKKVKRLEDKLNKSRRKRRLGRKIAQIDEDEGITLVQMGAQTRGRHDHEMEANFEFTTTEDVSTANVSVNTAGAEISTASPKVKTACVSIDDVAAEGLV
ncbi:hypothetical protein Tco_0083923 [Tanacetum coccineum]